MALSAIALCWLTAAFGRWAFGLRPGFYAGLIMATCVGLWLFTRIQIPDVMQTFTIALAMWALLRALDEEEPHPRLWAFLLAAAMGAGLLLKSLIGVVFPAGAGLIYLLVTRRLFFAATWKRLHPWSGLLVVLLIAAPWHILAALRNPPYFDFTMHSAPGEYHGFFWFFFINEQLLRFLNLRYPRDYNTVPRLYFWLFHLVWLFPWSVYLPRGREAVVLGRRIAPGAPASGALLDRLRAGLFYVFDHAGILFDALLSGSGAAAGIGDGRGRRLGPAWESPALRPRAVPGFDLYIAGGGGLELPCAGRHFCCSGEAARRDLHAFSRSHEGPHVAGVCLPANAAPGRRDRVSGGRRWTLPGETESRFFRCRAHDGAVLPRCAAGLGGLLWRFCPGLWRTLYWRCRMAT